MARGVAYSTERDVAVLCISNPPANALSADVRSGLMAGLERAEREDAVKAVVIAASGADFSLGAVLAGDQDAASSPGLRDVCLRIEGFGKPVVAALQGATLGGAAEVGLACHARVARAGAQIGFPNVRIGLPPEAGASQRAPRILGAGATLQLLLDGAAVSLGQDPWRALADVSDDDGLSSAITLAARLAEHPPERSCDRRDGLSDPVAFQREIKARKAALRETSGVEARIVDLVQAAALLPFEAGLDMEQDAFETCLSSPETAALRHAMAAERLAAQFALPEGTPSLEVARIAVLGAGPLAFQVTVSALGAGLSVHWGARNTGALAEGLAQLDEVFAAAQSKGRMTQSEAEARKARLKSGDSAAMVSGADLVIDAAWRQGDVPVPDGVPRATAMTGRVDALGLRFAPPVFATRLVEVIAGPEATPAHLAAGRALALAMKKVPVQVKSRGGTVAGRLAAALHRAADGLLDLGADPFAVDAATEAWGWPRAPFRWRDTLGLEALARAERAPGGQNWSAVLVREGRDGWVSGAGFYDWTKDGATRAQAVRKLLNAAREERAFDDALLVQALVGALANEGARMVAEGMVRRASDVDAVALLGMEFPRARGGPMKAAEIFGLLKLKTAMRGLGHPDQAFWTPVPPWEEAIKYGGSWTV